MNRVYITGYDAISALGDNIQSMYNALVAGQSGINCLQNSDYTEDTIYAGIIPNLEGSAANRIQQLLQKAGTQIQAQLPAALNSSDVHILLSSTKGNISALGTEQPHEAALYTLAEYAKDIFQLNYTPTIIATACISGLAAIIKGTRLLQHGKYKYVVVIGVDTLSTFTFKGFQSFHALADGPCRPFDKDRNGINLGECAASIILSTEQPRGTVCEIVGGALRNDANHLSGPSKTGQELSDAIVAALTEANITPSEVGVISAHGTATPYNDEMESKAIGLAGAAHAPVYSLKSHIGHTLGAAGVIETIIGAKLLLNDTILKSLNFESLGVPEAIHISTETKKYVHHNFLKTASGFGGCNAALVVRKTEETEI